MAARVSAIRVVREQTAFFILIISAESTRVNVKNKGKRKCLESSLVQIDTAVSASMNSEIAATATAQGFVTFLAGALNKLATAIGAIRAVQSAYALATGGTVWLLRHQPVHEKRSSEQPDDSDYPETQEFGQHWHDTKETDQQHCNHPEFQEAVVRGKRPEFFFILSWPDDGLWIYRAVAQSFPVPRGLAAR